MDYPGFRCFSGRRTYCRWTVDHLDKEIHSVKGRPMWAAFTYEKRGKTMGHDPTYDYYDSRPAQKSNTMRNIAIGVGLFLLVVICGGIAVSALSTDDKGEERIAPAQSAQPVATKSIKPSAKTSIRPATIREGTWEVGTDIKPGKYRTTGAVESTFPTCVW